MIKKQRKHALEQIDKLIIKQFVAVRKGRQFTRGNTKNKSRMSYLTANNY
jgi:hypothetical protein